MPKVILVIEDDPAQRKFVEGVLGASGYRTAGASDGEAGLLAARARIPDLIILDVMMPARNGYQTCRALRGEEATRDVPILMLTAKNQAADRFWAEQVGASGFLRKPVEPAELLEAVRGLLGTS